MGGNLSQLLIPTRGSIHTHMCRRVPSFSSLRMLFLKPLRSTILPRKLRAFWVRGKKPISRALFNSNRAKSDSKAAHDYGITERSFAPGDLVLLQDLKAKKKSFQSTFVGPFRVVGFGGSHDKSYVLEQLNKKPIPRIFYGDHLRLFVPRTGYLVSPHEESYPMQQNIRTGNYVKKS